MLHVLTVAVKTSTRVYEKQSQDFNVFWGKGAENLDRTNDSYSSLHTFQEYGVLYTHFHAYIPFATITTVVHQLLLLLSTFTASDPATIIKKSGMLLL